MHKRQKKYSCIFSVENRNNKVKKRSMICDHAINKCSKFNLNEVGNKFKCANESLTIYGITSLSVSKFQMT